MDEVTVECLNIIEAACRVELGPSPRFGKTKVIFDGDPVLEM